MRLAERINFCLSDKIVCVTEGIEREITKRYGVQEDKLVVIPNGANIELFRSMDKRECHHRLGLEKSVFCVGFVGSFAPWQGLEMLIEAAKQVKEQGYFGIKYLLVGDGELEPILRGKVQEYGLEGEMQFTGRVAYEKTACYMNTFDIYYLCKENLTYGFSPLKLYEYLACGRPLITSRVDGVTEVIEEGQCGYLFEVGDAKGLAERILHAYHERDKLNEMGVRGRQLVLAKYSWQSVANKVIEVLAPLLEKKGRRGERW